MGAFNLDIGISNSDSGKLEQFLSLFNVQSLIKKKTCITKTLVLTSKPLFFQSSSVIETCLSNHHKLITAFVKFYFTRLNQKTVYYYRNFKTLMKFLFK